MKYTRDLGEGVQMVRFTKDNPIEKLKNIGRTIAIRKKLESEGAGIPQYSRSEKKKIKKDMQNYFNSLRK